MAAEDVFKAIISVLVPTLAPLRALNAEIGKLTSPIHEVNEAFTGLEKPAKLFRHELSELSEHTGLTRIWERVKGVGEGLGHIAEQARDLLGPLAAVGAIGSAAGLVELARKASEYGAALEHASKRTGLPTDVLGEWHHVAEQTGTDAQTLDKSLEMLDRRLGDMARGKNKDLPGLFRALHIDPKAFKTAGDLLPVLATAFQRQTSETTKAAMTNALFGKSWAALAPLLSTSREELEALRQEARDAGLAWSPEQAEAAEKFEQGWNRMTAAVKGVGLAIGSALMPVLQPAVEGLRSFVLAHRTEIVEGFRKGVVAVSGALKAIDWPDVLAALGKVGAAIKAVAEFLGPTGTVYAAVAAFAAIVAGPLLYALAALSVALLSTPAGWVILGIVGAVAALSYAAIELYDHWSEAAPFFRRLWDGIKGIFSGALDVIAGLLTGDWARIIQGIREFGTGSTAALAAIGDGWDATLGAKIGAMLTHATSALNDWVAKASLVLNPAVGLELMLGNYMNSPGYYAHHPDGTTPPLGLPFAPGAPGSGAVTRLPSPYDTPAWAAGAPGAAGPNGKVTVDINLKGAPAGTDVRVQSHGAEPPTVNVGRNFPGGDPGYIAP